MFFFVSLFFLISVLYIVISLETHLKGKEIV